MKLRLELSLVHRMFIPVLLANMVVWLLWIADAIGQEVILDLETTRQRVSVPGRALQGYRTEPEALMFVRAVATVFDWPYDSPNLIELWSHDNRRLFHSTQRIDFDYAPLLGQPNQITRIVANQNDYNLIRYDGPRWSLRVAIPRPQRAQLYWQRLLAALQFPGLQVNFWLSLALLLLGLRLAIARGLIPLRLLANRLEQRRPDDLSPLNVQARYAELMPTVAALESLLQRLRRTLWLEQELVHYVRYKLQVPMDEIAAELALLNHSPDHQARQAARLRVEQAIGRASHLIRQLLDLARVDGLQQQNGTQQNGTQHDCAQLVREDLARMVPLAMARQIELSLEAPERLPFVIERNAFQMILYNLVENAIRYGRAGGVVRVLLQRQGEDLMLMVSDDGPGIAEAEREQVFERFYQGHAVGSDHGASSGLGLAIVRQAALRMGASVRLEPEVPGTGCHFTVHFRAPTGT
jgi:signal transduction histidine kinase